MCWAACDRLANIADDARARRPRRLLARARRSDPRDDREAGLARRTSERFAATFGGDELDASLLQLLDLRFLDARRPALPRHLRRGREGAAARRAHAALCHRGRFRPARDRVQLLHLLADRGAAPGRPRRRGARALRGDAGAADARPGCCREDTDFETGELWGNYPQTYSLVGLINCAGLLSQTVERGPMSRLIVISNRVSRAQGAQRRGERRAGSRSRWRRRCAESRGIWFGWSGEKTDEFTGQIDLQRDDGVTTATIDLEEQDVDEYYNGYANRTLWPLFHYRIDLAEYDRSFGSGYERVNERFAETVAPLIEPDDLVWVHDYHLIPLGAAAAPARASRTGSASSSTSPGRRTGCWSSLPYPPAAGPLDARLRPDRLPDRGMAGELPPLCRARAGRHGRCRRHGPRRRPRGAGRRLPDRHRRRASSTSRWPAPTRARRCETAASAAPRARR